ncbi:HAMP domain-containing protein [Deinococcus aerolatus]|uniref:HAMP domain-containing protein n=1 Tax=Deinococcus aerolatus TaxID=522487 RepID=A0ABQ2FYJ9_9DEIO|nr:HAMP domain-containing protein [Deinococcus aerolatus]GGL66509.1 HAMP domain-containing protein [Deinococcus aerolatus]
MKYTVTIQQPVQAERRPGLEQQLTERFNLSPEQAARLSDRRAGRLMKPTSRARAELLLDVFQLAGAAVALEEVPEDTMMMGEPFQGVAAAPPAAPFGRADAQDEALLAPLLSAPAWPSPLEPLDSPFATPAPQAGFAHLGGTATAVAPSVMDAAVWPAASTAPDLKWSAGLSDTLPASGAPVPEAPVDDVWSDFTGALAVSGTPPTASIGADTVSPAGPPVLPVVLPTVAADAAPRMPRRSLTQQLTLGTLAPLALSSAAALLLLGGTLPGMARQAQQQQAQTLAAAVGTTLGSGAALNAQLGAVVATPGVGFVRAETPGRPTILRAQDAGVGRRGGELTAWLGQHPNGGSIQLGETRYVVAQAAFRRTASGGVEVLPAGAVAEAPVFRRVVVGVPDVQSSALLTNALLLVLFAALLGLGLALAFARRAARQITDPLDRLLKAADAISMGNLSRPVTADRNDEIGDLAQALERMRQSLEAAMERLRRRRKG